MNKLLAEKMACASGDRNSSICSGKKMMIDKTAPIVPWEGLGGIKLRTHVKELYNIITGDPRYDLEGIGACMFQYTINGCMSLWFNVFNGKLLKIIAFDGYEGKLWDKIYVGMPMEEALQIDSSFEYDEFEEVYVSPKGIYIETDPETEKIITISVFIKGVDDPDFDKGDW